MQHTWFSFMRSQLLEHKCILKPQAVVGCFSPSSLVCLVLLTMGLYWLAKVLQLFLFICHVFLSFQLPQNIETLSGIVHRQAQRQTDRRSHNPTTPVQPFPKEPRFTAWRNQLGSSEEFTNRRPLKVKPSWRSVHKTEDPLQTANPLHHYPGPIVPSKQPAMAFPRASKRDGWWQQPEIHSDPLAENPEQMERDLPSASLELDPFVKSPGQIVPQRRLNLSLSNFAFDAPNKKLSQAYENPQRLYKPQTSDSRSSRWRLGQTRPPSPQASQRTPLTAVKTQEDQKTALQPPVAQQSVSAVCGEKSLHLTVKMDFLGTGHLINTADISLGGCAPTGVDESQQKLFFETPLHECGGTAQMLEDLLVYTFYLTLTPQPIGDTPVLRHNDATVGIECHYPRFHNVSSSALRPTWAPYQSSKLSGNIMDFSLRIMTDDWQYKRSSAKYFLGEMINIEASVQVYNHIPLRIFVEDCVAAVEPEKQSGPSYVLIENHGCLSDSKLMASRSQFMPRRQDEKLQMQIEAFRFADESLDSFYITCTLRAVSVALSAESGHKACHYSMENNRWNSADGNDQACSCCNTERCPIRKARATEEEERQLMIGPIAVHKLSASRSSE